MSSSFFKKRFLLVGLMLVFVFGVFQLVAWCAPTLLRFMTKSAMVSLSFSLPASDSLTSNACLQNMVNFSENFGEKGFRHEDNLKTGTENEQLEQTKSSDDNNNDGKKQASLESDNSKSTTSLQNNSKLNENSNLGGIAPPFMVGPPRVKFLTNDLQKNSNENDGTISRNCYGAGKDSNVVLLSKSAFAKNLTKLPNRVIESANKTAPNFKLTNCSTTPQVLILHTHATESYELQEKNYYSNKDSSCSDNMKITVVGVGEEIVQQLKEAKIGVLHDKKMYDKPSRHGSYDRANAAIIEILNKNPSIKVILDVHCEGIQNSKNERIAPVAKIDGRKAAQVMLTVGCDDGKTHHPNFEQNLAFACFLQRHLSEDYERLIRPLVFKYGHFNQSLTSGTLMVSVGSHSNSVDEARYAGWLFGKSLARALIKLKK